MQTKEQIAQKVRGIFVTDFGVPEASISPGAKLYGDLGLDSIDAIDMVVKLEKETGLKLKAAELRAIRTFQDVVDVIHGHLGRKDAAA